VELKNLPALPLHLELKVVRGILGQRSLSVFESLAEKLHMPKENGD